MKRPEFYVMYKDFQGRMEKIDILERIFDSIFNSKNQIRKDFTILDNNFKRIPVKTKEQLKQYIISSLWYFRGHCEWEFIAIDWPYRDTIEDSHPEKIDVYDQIEPNLPLITDIVWSFVEPKLKK